VSPKHALDDELKLYTEQMRALVDSTPPPEPLQDLHDQVLARLETPTGVHYLRDLLEQKQIATLAVVKSKLETEREARLKAEKWRADVIAGVWYVVKGVAIIVIGAALLWVGARLNR
jgi:hypothetical protein